MKIYIVRKCMPCQNCCGFKEPFIAFLSEREGRQFAAGATYGAETSGARTGMKFDSVEIDIDFPDEETRKLVMRHFSTNGVSAHIMDEWADLAFLAGG